jgi:hypothetical protein
MGGYLVAWNSYEEQVEVESYFTGASRGCMDGWNAPACCGPVMS